jgi:hypothetical protein
MQDVIQLLEECFIGINYLISIYISSDPHVKRTRYKMLGISDDNMEQVESIFSKEVLNKFRQFETHGRVDMIAALYFSLKDDINEVIGDSEYLLDSLLDYGNVHKSPDEVAFSILGSSFMKSKGINSVEALGHGAEKYAFLVNGADGGYVIKAVIRYYAKEETPVMREAILYKNAGAIRKYLPKFYGVSKFGLYSAMEYVEGKSIGLEKILNNKKLTIELPQFVAKINPTIMYDVLTKSSYGLSLSDNIRKDQDYYYAKSSTSQIKNKISKQINLTIDYFNRILVNQKSANELSVFLIERLKRAFESINPFRVIAEVYRSMIDLISVDELTDDNINVELLEDHGVELTTLYAAYLIRSIFEDDLLTELFEFTNVTLREDTDDKFTDLDILIHNVVLTDPERYGTHFKIIDFGGFSS